ncbi:MAG: ferredoxin [Thermofilaceae archaeon]
MSEKFAVSIERETCIADGACVALCPEIFELNENDGRAQITKQWRLLDEKLGEGIIPEQYEECVRVAAEACPVQVISVKLR